MSKAPIWPVATDALIADTTHLTTEEFGAYMLLMIAQWRSNGAPLPSDERRLARIARLSPHAWERARQVLVELFEVGADGWRQKRVEKDLVGVIEKIEANRASGSIGGKAKALKTKKPPIANATKLLPDTSSENVAIHEPYPEPELSSLRSDDAKSPKAPRSKPKTALPENFPEERDLKWAQDRWLQKGRVDLCNSMNDEVQKFRDHHTAKGTRSASWPASWRTWAGNALNWSKGYKNGSGDNGSRNSGATNAHQNFLAGGLLALTGDGGTPQDVPEPDMGASRLALSR